MAVGTYALTSVERAKAYLRLTDADLQVPALRIYNSSTDATAATVQITDVAMVLVVTAGVNAGTETLTFALAANDTIGELCTAITALAKGWVVTQYAPDDAASTDLTPVAATSALGDADAETLYMLNNWLVERLIDAASAFIESFCGRQFLSRSYSEWVDGTGSYSLLLDNYPITAIAQMSTAAANAFQIKNTQGDATDAFVRATSTGITCNIVGGTYNADTTTFTYAASATLTALATAVIAYGKGWTATVLSGYGSVPSTRIKPIEAQACNTLGTEVLVTLQVPDSGIGGYEYYADRGEIYYPYTFPRGHNNIYASYTAGYTTVPYDLEVIVWEVISLIKTGMEASGAYQSERMGDYSYVMADVALTNQLAEKLSLWRRIVT